MNCITRRLFLVRSFVDAVWLWPQDCTLPWTRTRCGSLVKIHRLTWTQNCRIRTSLVLTDCGRTNDVQTNGRTTCRTTQTITPLTAYCWRRRHKNMMAKGIASIAFLNYSANKQTEKQTHIQPITSLCMLLPCYAEIGTIFSKIGQNSPDFLRRNDLNYLKFH